MAAAADKARFFLEQSVPELKEYEKKKIFNKEEITAIVKKRSDFEHKLNARGGQPIDFVRYAQYEMNLDLLRRKR
ncbi:U3 snoRNP protein, partial [Elasticomyces elasticus]